MAPTGRELAERRWRSAEDTEDLRLGTWSNPEIGQLTVVIPTWQGLFRLGADELLAALPETVRRKRFEIGAAAWGIQRESDRPRAELRREQQQ